MLYAVQTLSSEEDVLKKLLEEWFNYERESEEENIKDEIRRAGKIQVFNFTADYFFKTNKINPHIKTPTTPTTPTKTNTTASNTNNSKTTSKFIDSKSRPKWLDDEDIEELKSENTVIDDRLHVTIGEPMAEKDLYRRTRDNGFAIIRRRLFPGYLFISTSDPLALDALVKDARYKRYLNRFMKILHTGNISGSIHIPTDAIFIPLKPSEEGPLLELSRGGKNIELSQGIIGRDGKLKVMVGPLKGKEKYVRRFDAHKRVAYLTIPGSDSKYMQRIKLGLEITENRSRK